jgi:histidinol dehydrogenase
MKLGRRLPERRRGGASAEVSATVRDIIEAVTQRGDAAVSEYASRFDGKAAGEPLEIDRERWAARAAETDPATDAALRRAADRIRRFHGEQRHAGYSLDGGELALRVVPLERVGVYAPGGTARYPSSVLMTAIPAALAGVDEVILVSPAASPETLRAAELAGVTRVFEVGGAHAIAALALGTDSVPRVDKIVGPGNQWVAEAKRQVFGWVDIDSIAGPSEVVIIADAAASPRWVAADLLAQAEHDVEAHPILIATSEALIDAVEEELERQLASLPRAEIARTALERHGAAALVATVEEAVRLAEAYAPEHLELMVEGARELAARIRFAGAIFVGGHSPEAAGDYIAGPNHVLPTAGAARFASPLGVYDFVRHISVIDLPRERLAELRGDIERLADVEGLHAHGRSVTLRFEDGE